MASETPPYYENWWFEWTVLLVCLGIGWLVWHTLGYHSHGNTLEDIPSLQVAQSILSGHGKNIFQPTANFPYLGQSPLYPLLLAVTMLLTRNPHLNPELIFSFKVLNFSFYLLSIFLVYKFCNQRIEKPFSTLITVLYTFSPSVLHAASHITPDIVYIVFSLLAILCFDKFISEQGAEVAQGPLFWCCFFVALSILTSNLGFALIGAFALLSLKHFGFQRGAKITLLLLIVLIPCYFLEWSENPGAFSKLLTPTEKSAFAHPRGILIGIADNTDHFLGDITDATLGVLDLNAFTNSANAAPVIHPSQYPVVRCLVGLLVTLGVSFGFSQYTGISSFYLLFYMLLSWLWPLQDSGLGGDLAPSLIPVLPILLLYLFLGIQLLGEGFEKFNLPVTNILAPILSVLLLLTSSVGIYQMVQNSFYIPGRNPFSFKDFHLGLPIPGVNTDRTSAATASVIPTNQPASTQQEDGYSRACDWIKVNTPANAQIISADPKTLTTQAQRAAHGFTEGQEPDKMVRELLQANYIVVEKQNPAVRKYLVPAIDKYQELFRRVYRDKKARISIWEVPPPPGPAQPAH